MIYILSLLVPVLTLAIVLQRCAHRREISRLKETHIQKTTEVHTRAFNDGLQIGLVEGRRQERMASISAKEHHRI